MEAFDIRSFEFILPGITITFWKAAFYNNETRKIVV